MKPYLIHPNVRSRGATAENPQAQPGAGGQALGGRKGAPAIASIQPGQVKTLLATDGPGIIRHIWITVFPDRPKQMRNSIIRMFWKTTTFHRLKSRLATSLASRMADRCLLSRNWSAC